jgi:uncharacterized protein YndB with AHSA1/START domain
MTEGSARIAINRPISEVYEALSDVTRMGDWSPECTAGRWVAPATGPAVGAEFEGDNIAKLGPITLKSWTTTSKVTECSYGEVFEVVASGYTTWRYEFTEADGSTTVTESFSHEPYTGCQGFLYGTLLRRRAAMVKGMQQTLERVKSTREAG